MDDELNFGNENPFSKKNCFIADEIRNINNSEWNAWNKYGNSDFLKYEYTQGELAQNGKIARPVETVDFLESRGTTAYLQENKVPKTLRNFGSFVRF